MIIDENQACFGEKVQIWYAISMHWSHFYTKWWCFRLYNATPWLFVSSSFVVAYLSQTCAKRKKIVPMRIKKDVRTITQSEEQEKLLSDLLGGIRDRKFNIELQFLVDENKKSNTRNCSSMLNLRCRMSLALLLHRKMYCQSYFWNGYEKTEGIKPANR